MIWNWIRDRRRRRILETPFPSHWTKILKDNVAHYRRLSESEQRILCDLIQVFIKEKNWKGCGGLVLEDEILVTIAAQACLMILNLPHDIYRNVDSILVYPSTVVIPIRSPGAFEIVKAPLHPPMPILGEAQLRGPVILVWDSIKKTARQSESGVNVVYHEFAHKLDMLDGGADGTPPLVSKTQYEKWIRVCEREFLRIREDVEKGLDTFLDDYAATNEAEFFAVATEQFFGKPKDMKKHMPALYEVLKDFYQQDPADDHPTPK